MPENTKIILMVGENNGEITGEATMTIDGKTRTVQTTVVYRSLSK